MKKPIKILIEGTIKENEFAFCELYIRQAPTVDIPNGYIINQFAPHKFIYNPSNMDLQSYIENKFKTAYSAKLKVIRTYEKTRN